MSNVETNITRLFPKGTLKGIVIIVIAALLSIALYNILPERLLSSDEDFDKYGIHPRKGLVILLFIAILWLTEAIHITITALLVPVIAAFSHIPSMETAAALSNFANPVIFLFFGGFALATALHIQKLDRKIALSLIALSGGNMILAVILMFLVTAFLSMWVSNTATAAMMLPLALGIMSNLDPEKDRNTFIFVLLGVAYSASIGGLGSLVGSPPNNIAARELGLTFRDWFQYGLPMMLVMLPIMIATLYLILKPKAGKMGNLQKEENIPWTLPRIVTIVLFSCIALSWIFAEPISKYFQLQETDSIIALVGASLVVIFGLASWKDISKNTEWGVLLLFGGGLTLSKLLQVSGASLYLGSEMAFVLKNVSPFITIFCVAAFILALTEFTSNTASAALFVPIFASVGEQMGMPKEVLVMVIGIGASCAFMLPVATPPNAIVFGTGLIRQRDMIRVGFILNIISVFVISLWAYFFLL